MPGTPPPPRGMVHQAGAASLDRSMTAGLKRPETREGLPAPRSAAPYGGAGLRAEACAAQDGAADVLLGC
jgi:hypothetical protein